MPHNTFIYVRISTSTQDLNKLIEECKDYCFKNNIKVTQIIQSTASSRQSQDIRRITELLGICKAGDRIITTELSRLGRNVQENRELFLDFKKKDVEVVFTRDSHKVLNDKLLGGLFFEVFSLFAEMERSLIAERTTAALNSLKNRGIKLGRKYSADYIHPKIEQNKMLIEQALKSKVSLNGISRLVGVNVKTLNRYLGRK